MKTFEVEFRKQAYIIVTVEAESRDEAEDKAWQELEFLATQPKNIDDTSWDVESIEEIRVLDEGVPRSYGRTNQGR